MPMTGELPNKMTRPVAFSASGDGVAVATLTGAHTLTFQSEQHQNLDPGGAHRDVALPAVVEGKKGCFFAIYNAADAAENLVIKSGVSTVATIGQGESVLVVQSPTAWKIAMALPTSASLTGTPNSWTGLQTFTAGIALLDADAVTFGTGSDIAIAWDAVKLAITQAAPNSAIDMGVDGAGIDVIFRGDTASATATWDQSADSLILAGVAKVKLQVFADPGTGAAIPVTHSGSVPLTIGAAETNTLDIPTYEGQTLSIYAHTVTGGQRAITASQAINQAGNTVMTFAAARDFIKLEGIGTAGGLRWQVVANDGAALS